MSLDHAFLLNQTLTSIGGKHIDSEPGWANFTDPRVVNFLLQYGRTSPTEGLDCIRETPFADWHRLLDPVHCHRNCVDLRCYVGTGQLEYRIVYGWALSDNDTWYCHSWCIKRTGPRISSKRPALEWPTLDLSYQTPSILLPHSLFLAPLERNWRSGNPAAKTRVQCRSLEGRFRGKINECPRSAKSCITLCPDST
jgi:hypothetical protein